MVATIGTYGYPKTACLVYQAPNDVYNFVYNMWYAHTSKG